jgi:hypothetical protein
MIGLANETYFHNKMFFQNLLWLYISWSSDQKLQEDVNSETNVSKLITSNTYPTSA